MTAARVQQHPAASLPLAAFLILAYFLLGAGSISDGHVWGDDWAQYLMHAQALLEGRDYDDIGYLFNPDAPHVGPPSYPPGAPLVLAPALAAFGLNLVVLKAVCFACVALALVFLYRLLAASHGESVAAVAVALFALHDQIWGLREVISSEAPYILFTIAALWYASRAEADGAGRKGEALRDGLVLGALTYASVACRSLGVALLVALLIYGWARLKPLSWFIALLGMFALLLALQNALLVTSATYSNELKLPTPALIAGNLAGYGFSLGTMFRLPLGLSPLAAAVVGALALLGIWSACAASAPGRPSGVRGLASRVPLAIWYCGAYLAALILAAISPNDRYLLPILPFIIAYAVGGAAVLAGHIPRAQRYALPVTLAVGLYYLALHVSSPRWKQHELATCAACDELYDFVRTRTPPDTVIAFAKPRAMALATGRAAWMWSTDYTPEELRNRLHQVGAGLVVIVTPGHALDEKYPAALRFADLSATAGARVVFQNAWFSAVSLPAGVPPEKSPGH